MSRSLLLVLVLSGRRFRVGRRGDLLGVLSFLLRVFGVIGQVLSN